MWAICSKQLSCRYSSEKCIMIPELKTPITSEFLKLENLIIRNSCEIEQWFRMKWQDYSAPFYSSIDLRNSGFKIAPVDTNLFPAGFRLYSVSLPHIHPTELFLSRSPVLYK